MPRARTKPNNEVVLIDTLASRATMSAPTKEMTMPTTIHAATRISRNSVSVTSTRISPSSPFSSSRPSRSSYTSAALCHTVAETPAGNAGSSRSSMYVSTTAATSSTSSPADRYTSM